MNPQPIFDTIRADGKEWAYMNLHKLKSGTDVRGTAIETKEEGPVQLTDPVVEAIALGFLCWCEKRLGRPAGRLAMALGR